MKLNKEVVTSHGKAFLCYYCKKIFERDEGYELKIKSVDSGWLMGVRRFICCECYKMKNLDKYNTSV